ncbi:hypothetical protein ALC57_02335, partial [Trachymyrmex cornetzi]
EIAQACALWLGGRQDNASCPDDSRKGDHWMPGDRENRRAPERSYRGKVHGNCVTVHKAFSSHITTLHPTLRAFGDTTHLSRYRDGTIVTDGNCSRGHRKVRSAIDWTVDDPATLSSL